MTQCPDIGARMPLTVEVIFGLANAAIGAGADKFCDLRGTPGSSGNPAAQAPQGGPRPCSGKGAASSRLDAFLRTRTTRREEQKKRGDLLQHFARSLHYTCSGAALVAWEEKACPDSQQSGTRHEKTEAGSQEALASLALARSHSRRFSELWRDLSRRHERSDSSARETASATAHICSHAHCCRYLAAFRQDRRIARNATGLALDVGFHVSQCCNILRFHHVSVLQWMLPVALHLSVIRKPLHSQTDIKKSRRATTSTSISRHEHFKFRAIHAKSSSIIILEEILTTNYLYCKSGVWKLKVQAYPCRCAAKW